jgi:hypothetical protein
VILGSRFNVLRSRTHFRRYRRCPVPFSCFALPDMFLTVSSASGPVFMFCIPRHVFIGTEGVGSNFHVLRARTCFRRKRGCRVPFLCFARPESFNAVTRASGTIFIFCTLGLIFDGTEDVGSHFSCFAHKDSFSAVPRASAPVFKFCILGLVCGGTVGVGSHFHVLRSRTHLRRFRYKRVLFSCFTHPNTSSAVPRASGLVFVFCAR